MELTIGDVSDSIFASLGVIGCRNDLKIPVHQGSRDCLVLIDGLGKNAIDQFGEEKKFLTDFEYVRTLSATFPSTTAASLTTLGTGLTVGKHGMVGYTMRVPNSGYPERILNALKWDERVDPEIWQPNPTLFQRAMRSDISVSHIAAVRYENSGFTRAALRGAYYRKSNTIEEQINATVEALRSPRSFAYVYLNDVDEASHAHGLGSERFLRALEKVDSLISGLIKELPAGVRIWITSDHGMINKKEHAVIGKNNDLLKDVNLMAGEPRVRYLYVSPENIERVAKRWLDYFGPKIDLRTRSEAISQKLFGDSVSSEFIERIGDLIVIAKEELILVEQEREQLQISMVGHHGGISREEVEIPLLLFET
ncbi:MAG: alkaline phosphatase family protein [Candidatus Nanopelagicaceae bacterium]